MGENLQHTSAEPMKLTYQLLQKLTDCFAEERKLGSGAFGVVYKGVNENGEDIAVKVFRNMAVDDSELQKEFQNLRRLKHQNIVELKGYCNESEETLMEVKGQQRRVETLRMALCLEYVDNGSLGEHLSDECQGLNWHVRYKIIKGICEGLKYLREGLDEPIWHLDLKPGNILLDKNMVPKIADFGLSRLFGVEETKKTINYVGTCGYWPPEYVNHQILSNGYDIFSLGVIIVKIMTGREGYSRIADMTSGEFVQHVHNNWRKKLQEILRHSSLEVYCLQFHDEEFISLSKSNSTSKPSSAYEIAMACNTCNTFSEIDVGKELLKIKSRVARHWDEVKISTGEFISLDMILIDEEGTKMHGVINKHCVEKFRSLIQEGNVYIITNVKVTSVTSAAKFRPVDNDKVLNFLATTTLEKIEDTEDIPRHGFKFSDINMLSKRIDDMVYLSDVIGVATYIGPIEETRTNFGVSNIRDIVVLIDYEEVKVRLWGVKAEQIDVSATAKTIVVTSTTVKKFGSYYSLSSSNATQVYLNLLIPETIEVQNRNCSRENTIKQIGNEDHLKGTFEQQMEYNKKTLQELNEILNDSSNKARIFTVEATINAINTRYGWYYISCNDDNCKKTT